MITNENRSYLYSLIGYITASFKLFIFLLMQTKSYLCTDMSTIIMDTQYNKYSNDYTSRLYTLGLQAL